MSSEWKDPGTSGEHLTSPIWHDPEEAPLLQSRPPRQQPEMLLSSNDYSAAAPQDAEDEDADETETDDLDEAYSSRLESLLLLGRQFSPILVPLLFGLLTLLFVLLPVTSGRAYLSSIGLLPVALILVAIAVIHAMLLYYAGANNALWLLALIAGFALFALAGCFTAFGPLVSLIALLIFAILGGLLVKLCVHPVPEGQADIAYSFGRYNRTLFPGPNLLLPWERVANQLNTRESQWTCPAQTVHISREEDLHLAATVSYQLLPEDAHLAVIQVNDWDASLQKLFVATIQSVAAQFTPQDFVAHSQELYSGALNEENAPRWEMVNEVLLQQMQDHVATWGVQIHWVRIHDVTLTPVAALMIETGPMERLAPSRPAPAAVPGSEDAATAVMAPPAGGWQNLGAHTPATPAAAATPPVTPKAIKEEVLMKTYNAVRDGVITEPETIRSIAARFDAIASDPELSKLVSFDAARAALTLHQRADLLLEQRQQVQVYSRGYGDDTQLERSNQPPHA